MSEGLNLDGSDSAGAVGGVAVEPTAGALLRAAREAQGLHIAALAVSLKVPVKKLEALEADRLDLLPDAVFARALASSMCRALKVDPSAILARLPQTGAPRLEHNYSGINAPFRSPSDGPGPSLWSSMSRPAVLGVFALLLGALVLIFLPEMKQASLRSVLPESVSTPLPSAAGSAAALGVGTNVETSPSNTSLTLPPLVGDNPGTAAASTASFVATPLVATPLTPALSTPTVSSPTLVITAASGDSTPPGPTDGIVVFKTKGESWVEVLDAQGRLVLRRTLAAGEQAGASGPLPLRVTVGRADQTAVSVRSKALDLTGKVRDNVARFEVR